MNKFIKVFTIVMAAALLVPQAALAGGDRDGVRGEFKHYAKKLDLSAEQREELKSLIEAAREESKPLREKKRALVEKARSIAFTDSIDKAALKQVSDEAAEVHAQLVELRWVMLHEVRALLTQEQQEKFDNMKHEARNKKHRK